MNLHAVFCQANKITKNKHLTMLIVVNLLYCLFFVDNTNASNDNNISFGSNLGIYKDIVSDENADFFSQPKPVMHNRIIAELDLDDYYRSTNHNKEFKETAIKAKLFNNIHLNNKISLNSYLKLQDVKNLNRPWQTNNHNGRDRFLKDLGLFAEEINLRYLYENKLKKISNNLILGKFNLGFGTAWRWDRGISIHSLAETYKQTEKIGIANVLQLGNAKKTGQYNFGLSFFYNDQKILDNALFANKHSDPKSSAIPGDSRALKSYNFSTDINFDFKKNEKLSYHFSYLNLDVNGRNSRVNPSKVADQKGIAYAINYQYPLSQRIILDGLIEYTKINNYLGNSDQLRSYLSSNLLIKIDQSWNLLLGNTRLKDRNYNDLGFNQNFSEISAGYQFKKNNFFDKLTLQIGYRYNRLSFLNQTTETQSSYGLLLRYFKDF
ncbi:MAG: hypothetical protein ACKO47_05905 [Alphaproteobacteria bacterium]